MNQCHRSPGLYKNSSMPLITISLHQPKNYQIYDEKTAYGRRLCSIILSTAAFPKQQKDQIQPVSKRLPVKLSNLRNQYTRKNQYSTRNLQIPSNAWDNKKLVLNAKNYQLNHQNSNRIRSFKNLSIFVQQYQNGLKQLNNRQKLSTKNQQLTESNTTDPQSLKRMQQLSQSEFSLFQTETIDSSQDLQDQMKSQLKTKFDLKACKSQPIIGKVQDKVDQCGRIYNLKQKITKLQDNVYRIRKQNALRLKQVCLGILKG